MAAVCLHCHPEVWLQIMVAYQRDLYSIKLDNSSHIVTVEPSSASKYISRGLDAPALFFSCNMANTAGMKR